MPARGTKRAHPDRPRQACGPARSPQRPPSRHRLAPAQHTWRGGARAVSRVTVWLRGPVTRHLSAFLNGKSPCTLVPPDGPSGRGSASIWNRGAGCASSSRPGGTSFQPQGARGEAEAAPSAGRQSCQPGLWGAWAGIPKPLLPSPVSNILKAAAGEGESRGSAKPHENLAGGNRVAQNDAGGAPLRRKEVTEEEAER